MGIRSTHHTRTFRAGAAIATSGLLFAASGLGAAAAGAAPGGTAKVTICHATSSVTNPYTSNSVAISAVDGSLGKGGNDHTGHTGPVFDFTADPSDPGYPYHPPMKGDAWGDIIPSFEWDGGSFPGLNWDEVGQAIHESGCAAPAAPGDDGDDDVQPGGDDEGDEGEGTQPGGDDEGDQDDEGEGTQPGGDDEGDDGDDGVQPGGDDEGEGTQPGGDDEGDEGDEGEGTQPGGDDEGDEGDDGVQPGGDDEGDEGDDPGPADACPDVDGIQADAAECEVGLIPPVVIENDQPAVEPTTPRPAPPEALPAPPRRPTQVAGIQVLPSGAPVVAGQQLPRTGSDTRTLAMAGFGLVLLGAGAMIAARRPLEAPVR